MKGTNKKHNNGRKYFRIVLHDKDDYIKFRTQDVGDAGHLERIAGKGNRSNQWSTVSWLVSKDDAHVEKNKLVPDSDDAKQLFETLGATPKQKHGDIFAVYVERRK